MVPETTFTTPETVVLSKARVQELISFTESVHIRFRSIVLLNLAFSHRSFDNESPLDNGNNEKLEFLGDSVLGMVISEYLYRNFPEKSEGDLAKMKAHLVSEDTLSSIAISISIPKMLLIGKGEENSGGRSKKAILADAFEAIIGALFIDSGLEAARNFIIDNFADSVQQIVEDKHRKDYKTLLQEYTQKHLHQYPRYVLVGKSGPDHAKIFSMEVHIGDEIWGPADGCNKKEAEQKAALMAWESIALRPQA